ncbi:MAG TPA: serine/threonine-protein kinase [Aquabacterium sp.]|uniref:serine/threonine-protein kinase n=1 Tax=Aquabacterium sp. TaxID=1872578 RepID=UPI002E38079D|nr:serine/threonine-protein kinase [Aquabacterium sp.]HEX5357716.1 serine/threonine-protein kinase [Aquabacterium sp.]
MADDHIDTIAETRPLPEPETVSAARGRPDLLPSIGHIGRYALKYKIGEGGLGTVYAAHDPLLSRLIAIKTLHVDMSPADREQFNALFLNEAKAAGSLNHPHIVTMYDAGTSEQGTYIAMELLRGKDLRQLLAMGWKPTPAQSALIVRRVADALSYAHHKGVIHRDIKPANIFMVGRTQPRVLDFGIARIRQAESLAQRDDPQSRFQEIVGGSPYYMAPEQVQHKPVDRRVDVYALGVVLYELLTFKRAFSGNSLEEIADAVLSKPVPLVHEVNPDVPKVLSEIVARAMHRDPEQRTRSARRLSAELRSWLEGVEGRQDAAAFSRSGMGARVGRPGLWTVAVAGWLAALLGVGWLIYQSRTSHVPAAPVPDVRPSPVAAKPSEAVVVASVKPAPAEPVAKVPAAVTAVAQPVAAVAASAAPVASAVVPSVVPQANGTLKLAISPWGEVLVDGRAVGVAPPLHQLSLSPGAHVITIRNGDSPDFRQTIEVRADKVVHVKHQF